MPLVNSLSCGTHLNLWELSRLAGVFGCLIRGEHYTDPPAPGPRSTLRSLRHDIEHLLDGVTNDGW